MERELQPVARTALSTASRGWPVFRKYVAIAIIDWQSELAYRANSLIWIAWSIFPSAVMMLVWLAAYGDRQKVGRYSLSEMITYYLLVTTLSISITPNHEWETAAAIREGQVTPYLVRPIDYFWFRAMTETAYQVMKTMMALPGLALMAWLFRDYIRLPHLSVAAWLGLIAACGLCYGMLMCIKSALAYLAFWFGEIGGVLEAWNIIMMIFAGRLIPLDLLPKWLQGVGAVLPFKWLYPFTLGIAQGHVSDWHLLPGLAMQAMWLIVLFGLMRLFWSRGLRAYEGYGG